MIDPVSKLRSATRRAKSDVANKLISMLLHELSRKISQGWGMKVDGEEYGALVRQRFGTRCPYCSREMTDADSIIEHLDGMNRYRAGLHVPGNVLVACRKCNNEKRRDDSPRALSLAGSGWQSFLSHDGTKCTSPCRTCKYWASVWGDEGERTSRLAKNLERIVSFRALFREFNLAHPTLMKTLPELSTKLYLDCQNFAENEIKSLLEKFETSSNTPGAD